MRLDPLDPAAGPPTAGALTAERGVAMTSPPDPPVGMSTPPSLAARRWRALACWLGGAIGLFPVLLRISGSVPVRSDAANNVLQAWDMLHGNVVLHGWIVGDVSYYAFELPLYVIAEHFFGLRAIVPHIVSPVIYLIVVALALAVARAGSRGRAATLRSAFVLAAITAPLLTSVGIAITLEKPDHFGTSASLLASFYVADRLAGRRLLPPLLGAILVAGQLSDPTVLYVGVPAILVVCAGRLIAARSLRTADAVIAITAVTSVGVTLLVQMLLRRLGGYWLLPPKHHLAGFAMLHHNSMLTGRAILRLFGVTPSAHAPLGLLGAALGLAVLLMAVIGIGKAAVSWRRATRADHLVVVAVLGMIAAYLFSTIPVPTNANEIAFVLPGIAVLGARGLVPPQLAPSRRTVAAIAVAVAAAVLPLSAAATVSAAPSEVAPLATWLEAHGLTYGVSSYWTSSAITLQTGGRVHVVALYPRYFGMQVNDWETDALWYNPYRHRATFVIADLTTTSDANDIAAQAYERSFGQPAATYRVAGKLVLIYRKNLLWYVTPGPVSAPPAQLGIYSG